MIKTNSIALIALLFFVQNFSFAQQIESTTITCLEVLDDGTVGITWTPIPDVNGIFLQYQVSRHDIVTQVSTTFTNVTDVNTGYFLDNGVDALAAPVSYEIIVAPSSGVASNSNILCTILLNGIFTAGSGIVSLSWNDPVPNYSQVPAGTTYKLMEEYPVGDWHEVAEFFYEPGLTEYNHAVSVCDDMANYRLELCFPQATCSSISNTISINVTDETPPPTPQITSISVDTLSGLAVIDWNSVDASDCGGYIVTWCDAPGLPQEQVVDNCNLTEFTFPTAIPFASSEHFLVAAYDTCSVTLGDSNTSATEGNCPYIHSSIHLTSSFTTCQDFIDIFWTPYTGWGNNGVAVQEVYRRDNGGNSELIATLDGTITTYRDNIIEDDHEYCYFVWAYSATVNNAQSISNISCEITTAPVQPVTFSMFTATVTNPDENTIILNTSPTVNAFEYVLLRKSNKDPFFQEVDSYTSNNATDPFIDSDVNTSTFYYDYKVALVNECSDTVNISNIGRTIKVDGLANSENLINTITWNPYENWENGVDIYEIYRSVDGDAPELIATNPNGVLYYEDDVSDQLHTKGEFCYFVIAHETANTIGISAISTSNVLCLAQPPKVWIPNAFAVNGFNDEFFPTISFADRDTYRLIIYNRWGQELFATLDIDDKWDGTKNGNLIQEGTYMYYIEISDGSGQIYEFRGPITLLIFDAN